MKITDTPRFRIDKDLQEILKEWEIKDGAWIEFPSILEIATMKKEVKIKVLNSKWDEIAELNVEQAKVIKSRLVK